MLTDLLRARWFPVTRLPHLFRQGAGSGIARNAQRILAGEVPRFRGDSRDCFFLVAEEPAAALWLWSRRHPGAGADASGRGRRRGPQRPAAGTPQSGA